MSEALSNSLVLSYSHSHSKTETLQWLQRNAHDGNEGLKPSIRSFEHRLKRVIDRNISLKKNKSRPSFDSNYKAFLEEEFTFPKVTETPKIFKKDLVEENPSSFLNSSHAETAHNLSIELAEVKKELELTQDISQENDSLRVSLCQKRKLVKSTAQREKYYKKKLRKFEIKEAKKELNCECHHDHWENKVRDLESQIRDLKKELSGEKVNSEYLQSLLQDNSTVALYDEELHRYTPKLQLCVYDLLKCNVATSKVSSVIESVLTMVGMTPNRLPSNSKVKDMNVERLVCAQKQIAEDLVDSENLCLMSDETSKYGKKYQGFHLSDSSGSQWVLGVRELHSKSAVDVMSSFKEVLDDIGQVAKVSEETTSQRLLYNITSTMSDKAATEAKFHSLLEEYRKDVLPTVVDNFHCMNVNEQECVSRLHNFFCGIHSIVHLAEGASAALVETEKGFFLDERPIMDKSFLKKTESGTARLIRTASKAVARGGDESAGCHQQFMDSISAFRKQHKLTSLPLEPYRGHRFNILFSNAAALFFIHRILLDFLNTFQNNRLLKAVLFDLKVPEYLAGVKALGLVSKFLTEPLWSMIERKDNHILDMNNNYTKVVSFLTEAAMNPTKLMSGDLLVFGERTQIRKDGMYYSLLERWDHDDKVESILGVMLGTLTKVAQHQFRDHLADGKLETLATDADVRKQTQSVPTHNKFSETVFGFFDQLVRARPSITPLVSESYILYSFNKTSAWLHEKDDIERQDILKFARENVVKTRAKFKERQNEVAIARQKKMEERRKKEEDLAARRVAKMEKLTEDIVFYGLWQHSQQIDNEVQLITSEREKVKALKAQLNFRRQVFKQVADKTTYSFSKRQDGKSVPLTVEELAANLKTLVKSALAENVEEDSVLVGKRVRHQFQLTPSSIEWFQGRVISQVPGYPTWFNVVYEGDEAVYTYQLLEDQEKGTLEVLPN